ncbi:hypothetical protein A5787_12360 [Mycobacterium sp. 852002-50816_SCH5313054-b]|uniref:DUF6779 domain-containing protein n=1 Tax=Mycobacterium sp. 852002-50816_SCH5313054-b TaxID=1834092 RepID=UPI0008004F04|nr:DUF6779 domain-containing protein [Mycobacterium sp. 852002-50816_SCH5313054-b]OBF45628.1 hypothetical protein A5787_12360 [Mycobacterium sp. 852002-50816_SCH5313054-b]
MTVLSRGARVRRGGRRPGWVLLTALLVLAMGASSALVFTNRVELLKLAVILALWAAVAGAFVSVLYRRQSDADQSRVRDLKLVYDLQLDREISARREYELTVESQLRRELASELRAQAEDDLAALRAELSALRTSLEILFDTDLQHHPALETVETEAPRTRAYSDWDRNGESNPDWVASDRVTSVTRDNPPGHGDGRADEAAIIDVPEEPLLPPRQPPSSPGERVRAQYEVPPEARYVVSQEPPYMTAPPEPEPRFDPRQQPPPPPPQPQPQMQDWQPAGAQGLWLPPGAPGGNWAGAESAGGPGGEPTGGRRARHYGAGETLDGSPFEHAQQPPPPYGESGGRARARHSADYRDFGAPAAAPPPPHPMPPPPAAPPPPQMAPPPSVEPVPRHRGADPLEPGPEGSADGPPSGGQSVAELLARLQAEPSGGGRRRRRDG